MLRSILSRFRKPPVIEVICVTYKQTGPLKVFIQSFLNQTKPNWRLNIIHDGYDEEFIELMSSYSAADGRIKYSFTSDRHNDWGHSLRRQALENLSEDYVLVTNGDNYYVPIFIEAITQEIEKHRPDVVLFDMIHSHNTPGGRDTPSYSYFKTDYSRYNIDMGAAVVKSALAKKVGFRDLSHDGDATYFEDIKQLQGDAFKLEKIDRVLFVHN